jgi:hypothetical protein
MKPHKCTFVGYGELQGVKIYHLYSKDRRKYLVSLNVTFDKETLLNSKEIEHDDTLQIPLAITTFSLKKYMMWWNLYLIYHNNNP